MSKKTFNATYGGIVLIAVTLACSLSSSPPSSTQSPNFSPTDPVLIQPTSTESLSLPPTSVPQTGLKQEWTIKTGDIQYIGVASDGTIYGVGPNLYAIISKDGEVLQTNEMDFTNCIRDNFSGGASDTEIDRWFTIRSDGIILTTTGGRPCIISPGNPPLVEKLEGNYFPYADEIKSRKTPSTPDGFRNNFGGYLYFSQLTTYDFFVSPNKRLAAFVDHNGEIRYFDLPQDLDVEKRLNELRVGVTPWDDVYLSYPAYDALGNDLGQKNMKIEENGTANPISGFPYLVKTLNDTNSISNLAWIHPIYLPERNEVYFYQGDSITVHDLDFNYLREYPLPPGFPEISYGVAGSTNKLFVGYDGAIYVFDIKNDENGKTLTKYSIPSTTTQIQENPTLQSSLEIGSTIISDKDGMTLLYVPEGEFTMGSNNGGTQEQPVHLVFLDAFWIDQTEVTLRMYHLCVDAGICKHPTSGQSYTRTEYYGYSKFDNYPVINVDWNMAKTYCEWANRRLPTEAEWEKAARGTDGRTYPWGEDISCSRSNFWLDISSKDGHCVGDTTEVGSFPNGISPYGALDMGGNVSEWVADWHGENYYSISPSSNPLGPDSGQNRVLKGGSWADNDFGIRSSFRFGLHAPNESFSNSGFRCAMDATP